ncbi:YraN family protein [Acetobacteraceae bacterium]|nr:YraN family protein [Acetobacteraceae bacterium]
MFHFLSRFSFQKIKTSLQSNSRKEAYQIGLEAEKNAEILLKQMGFKILAQRFKTKMGEIDLLAANKKLLIAVEVKKRKTLEEGQLSLRPRQCKRLQNALNIAITLNPEWMRENIRFDMFAFDDQGNYCHVPNILQD